VVQPEQFDLPLHLPLDGIELRHGAVLVVVALDGEYRADDAGQVLLDVPGAEFRVQPDVVPAAEGVGGIDVMARKLALQVGGLEGPLAAAMLFTLMSSTNTCGASSTSAFTPPARRHG